MTFTIPNLADAAFAPQAYPGASDIEALVRGLAQTGVKTNCAVTAKAPAAMTVAVAAGTIYAAGGEISVSGGDVSITAANATNPRRDLVVASSAGVKSAVTGSAGAVPVAPAIPAGSIALAEVYVPANASVINSNQIIDKRVVITVPSTGTWVSAYKTADQSKTSDSAISNDADMHVAVAANAVYSFDWMVVSVNAGTNTMMRLTFTGPTSSSGWYKGVSVTLGNEQLTINKPISEALGSNQDIYNTPSAATFPAHGGGILITAGNSGNLSFAWGQSTSHGDAVTLKKGSWIRALRMA